MHFVMIIGSLTASSAIGPGQESLAAHGHRQWNKIAVQKNDGLFCNLKVWNTLSHMVIFLLLFPVPDRLGFGTFTEIENQRVARGSMSLISYPILNNSHKICPH